jgi:hypothetical protein
LLFVVSEGKIREKNVWMMNENMERILVRSTK